MTEAILYGLLTALILGTLWLCIEVTLESRKQRLFDGDPDGGLW